MDPNLFEYHVSLHLVLLTGLLLPGFHAWFNLHRFLRARHHSHKHLSGLWVVLSLQVFIHTVLYVCSQARGLKPFDAQWRNISKNVF